jgi:hypothetical protein
VLGVPSLFWTSKGKSGGLIFIRTVYSPPIAAAVINVITHTKGKNNRWLLSVMRFIVSAGCVRQLNPPAWNKSEE